MPSDPHGSAARAASAERFFRLTRDVEHALGLPGDLILELLKEDEWSLVIRCHALLEAAANSLLVDALGDRLAPAVRKMRMWQRITFLEGLDLWTPAQLRFARLLGELRNDCVHDVSQARFDFKNYLTALPEKEQRRFWQTIAVGDWPTPATGEPESIVWWRTIEVLAHTAFVIERRAIGRRDKSELEQLLERLNTRLAEGELDRISFAMDAMYEMQRRHAERRKR